MAQSLSVALNCIISDTSSNSRRSPFGGNVGWEADSGVSIAQYQIGTTPIGIGSSEKGFVLTSDQPITISFIVNGQIVTLVEQTVCIMSGALQNITLVLTNGYTKTSLTNVALVS